LRLAAWLDSLAEDLLGLQKVILATSPEDLLSELQAWIDTVNGNVPLIQDSYWASAAVFQDANPNPERFGPRVSEIFFAGEDQADCPPRWLPDPPTAHPRARDHDSDVAPADWHRSSSKW